MGNKTMSEREKERLVLDLTYSHGDRYPGVTEKLRSAMGSISYGPKPEYCKEDLGEAVSHIISAINLIESAKKKVLTVARKREAEEEALTGVK